MFLLIKCPPKANSESGQTLYKHLIVEKVVPLAFVFTQSDFKLVLWLISTYADWTKTFPTCSYLAAGWSLKFAVTVPFPACWWTENSPEALSLSEMCGLGPDEKQKQRINSQKSVFRWQVQHTGSSLPLLRPHGACVSALLCAWAGSCWFPASWPFGCERHATACWQRHACCSSEGSSPTALNERETQGVRVCYMRGRWEVKL